MNDREGAAKRVLRRVAAAGTGPLRAEIAELQEKVAELDAELQESRRLNRRVAELLDIVEELLVPVALRDEEKVRRYLDAHSMAP